MLLVKERVVLRSKLSLLPLIGLTLTLMGCDKTKEVLGLKRSAPDEMQVIERPPLSMPPGYGLRPPLPSQQAPAARTPRDEAEASLLKKEHHTSTSSDKSVTESEILKKANADTTDPDIRDKIASEIKSDRQSIGEQLAFWTDNRSKGQVIDPQEENEKYNGSPMPGQLEPTSVETEPEE
jgi:hypothetical protein